MDITGGFRIGWGSDPGLDPPHRSISEGRGLPHTRLIRAMLPFTAAAIVALLAFVAVMVAISSLLD
jgi:Na+/proline symporter